MQKKILPVKTNPVFFIKCTELTQNRKFANGLCFYIFYKDTGWYLGVIGNLHNDEFIIYIFMGEVLNGTINIFTNSQYHFWYK